MKLRIALTRSQVTSHKSQIYERAKPIPSHTNNTHTTEVIDKWLQHWSAVTLCTSRQPIGRLEQVVLEGEFFLILIKFFAFVDLLLDSLKRGLFIAL